MSLNDIELSRSLIEELYKDALLISPAAAASSAPPPALLASPASSQPAVPSTATAASAPAYKFLGNNQKKITILVDSPETAFLPDDQLGFLVKMLEACKMNMGDVAIVNRASSGADMTELKRQLAPAYLLLLGPGPENIRLPIHFPLFKIQAFDQCSFLWTPPLAQFLQPGEEGKLLKTKLWVCLKQLFEV
jgi:hypothetical protein